MSHDNAITDVDTCPVCGRKDVALTDKPPLKAGMPPRRACTDEFACFATHSANNA